MKKYLICKNLCIEKSGRLLLQDFTMSVFLGESVCLLGESGSGKTTLFQEVASLKSGVFLMGSMNSYFLTKDSGKDWKKELLYSKQNEVVQKFLSSFFKNKRNLSYKIALLKKVFQRPNFFLLDDLSPILNVEEKKLFFSFLDQLSITVCYATRDVEDVLFFPYTIVLKKKKIAIEGKTNLVLQEEKVMKLLGYSLPFYVDLSFQLSLYGVIDNISYSKEEMEENLWP